MSREYRLDHEKLPPQNRESEDGVLGSILHDPHLVHEVAEVLRPEDFYQAQNEALFRAMLGMAGRGTPVDVATLAEELHRTGQFDRVGGNDTLVRVHESVPHTAHALYYAAIVREKAISRGLIEAANDILRDGYSNQFSAQDLLERAYGAVLEVDRAHDRQDLVTLDEAALACQDRIDRRRDGREAWHPSGLRDLDAMLGGFQPGHVIIVAARPSIGKSALLLGLGRAIADGAGGSGRQVLYVSLEMTADELAGRVLSSHAEINGRQINVSPDTLRDEDLAALARAREDLRGLPIRIDQSSRRTVAGVGSRARRLKHRGGLAAVVVDYLQLLTPDPKLARAPRHEQVAAMSRDLHCLAVELQVPVIVACQVNRESERPQGRGEKGKPPKVKPPRLADLRESGAIEQDANQVLILHRPEFYDATDRPGEADLIVAKNRGGRTGKVRLRYDARFTRFRDFEDEVDPAVF